MRQTTLTEGTTSEPEVKR